MRCPVVEIHFDCNLTPILLLDSHHSFRDKDAANFFFWVPVLYLPRQSQRARRIGHALEIEVRLHALEIFVRPQRTGV